MARYSDDINDGWGGRTGRLLRPYMGKLLLVIVLLSLLAITNMALPYAIKLLIDDVFPSQPGGDGRWGLLWLILPGLALIYVVRNALFYASRMHSVRISEDLCFSLRKRLFEHLQQLSLRFYRSNQPGKVSSRVMDDTYKIQSFIQEKLPTLMLSLLMFQVLLVVLYAVSVRLAFASTIVLPLHFATYRYFKLSIKRSHSEAQENLASAYGSVVEKFLGIEVVKGFAAERRESATFHEALDASRQSQIKTSRFQFGQKVVADLLIGLGTVFLFGFGAREVMQNRMTAGEFFMFFGYVGMLYPSVLEVLSGLAHLSKTTASVDRVFEMLDEPAREHAVHSDAPEDAAEFKGEIAFSGVSFAHDDSKRVLRDLSLEIPAGQHVAITGPSGSGKTTLISLIPRFIEADEGGVLVDGREVREHHIRALRNAVGIAFQDVFLFNASIEENLRYARPDATPEEILEVARLTGAHEFVKRLPDGYRTRIGAAGAELSRGEKQRLTLARALLKNPRILILDEATASIDSQSARSIIQSIFERMQGRTVIMVTHETDLLDLAERVVTIAQGKVTYDGDPIGFVGFDPDTDTDGESGDLTAIDADFLGLSRRESAGDTRTAISSEPKPGGRGGSGRHGDGRSIPGRTLGAIGLAALIFVGCVSNSQSTKSIAMEHPRTTQGLMTVESDTDSIAELETAWREKQIAELTGRTHPADLEPGFDADEFASRLHDRLNEFRFGMVSSLDAGEQPASDAAGELADADGEVEFVLPSASAITTYPDNAGRLVDLPRMSTTEIRELIDAIALTYTAERGYETIPAGSIPGHPDAPPGVTPVLALVKSSVESGQQTIRLGYRRFLSQPPKLWMYGVTETAETVAVNVDIDELAAMVQPTLESMNAMRQGLTSQDLEAKVIQLNYTTPASAMAALKGLGVTTFDNATAIPATMNLDQLPVAVVMPEVKPEDIGLVGEKSSGGSEFGLSISPTTASSLNANTIGSPVNEILVLFHPAHPAQFSRVKTLLRDVIDRPARQIFVEGMVLEISEDGLRDLGIEWSFEEGPIEWMIGSLSAGSLTDTLNFSRLDSRDVSRDWGVEIRALLRDGKAEILSRPSVLTLNGRQATIRVGEDIPIATSQEGLSGSSNKIAFNFKYLATGILLNVRPRITEDGSEVNLLIDTIVSATVPGRDLEIRSTDGNTILATAPTVSTRRVQTYARLRNNTPFIIGGLVSRDQTVTQDKVPILGDLPLIGPAFRAERTRSLKREVIIVLTPHVLEDNSDVARSLPKDADAFDSFGNELFRSAYRIRTEDVFDLTFLLENRRLQVYRRAAERLIDENFRLAGREPFESFANGGFPGENVLVHRMVYEVIKRLGVDEQIDPNRLIFFADQQAGGYEVRFLDSTLAKIGDGRTAESFFELNPNKALALTFYRDRDSLDPDKLASEPVPELSLIDCADRDSWNTLLWELNQPVGERQRYTILIKDADDLVRLRRSVMLKRIIGLNGGEDSMTLQNFSIGKVLLMPEVKPGQAHVIDVDTAQLFFHTELYYAAAIQRIDETLRLLDRVLRRAGRADLLDEINEATEDDAAPPG
ncbi:MAG: ABC transporter transmembrane domain-containing protein [Phycisphaerales bacterium]